MRIGKLYRKLTIQRFAVPEGAEANDFGEDPEGAWQDLYADIWANKRQPSGNEALALDQIIGTDSMVFTIRYKEVKATDRILFEGRLYNIIPPIKEIGRRYQLELIAEGKDNAS